MALLPPAGPADHPGAERRGCAPGWSRAPVTWGDTSGDLAGPGQRSAAFERAEHQVRDLPGLLQVRLVRHPGQLAVAAATQAPGQLAAARDQERHVKLAAGDRDRDPDLVQAVPRVHAAAA